MHYTDSSIRRRDGSTAIHHNKTRETPLAIYVGLTVHAMTRKRGLVDRLFQLGLSISYDRVMSTTMGNRVCEQYHRDQSVCPTYDRDCSLQQRLITLITTPAQQPPVIHSTVLESHYSNTPPLRTVGRIVGNDGKVFPKALDEEFE